MYGQVYGKSQMEETGGLVPLPRDDAPIGLSRTIGFLSLHSPLGTRTPVASPPLPTVLLSYSTPRLEHEPALDALTEVSSTESVVTTIAEALSYIELAPPTLEIPGKIGMRAVCGRWRYRFFVRIPVILALSECIFVT